jgi:CHAT domain
MSEAQTSLIHRLDLLNKARLEPERCAQIAVDVLATPELDPDHVGVLHAVVARAAIERHDIEGAVVAAKAAVDHESTAVPAATRGEIRAVLAYALTMTGRLDAAVDVLDAADDTLGASADGLVDVQRCVLLYRQGRLKEALRAADRALAHLPPDRQVDRARALNNRAVAGLYLGRLDHAMRDFDDAERVYRAAHLARFAADVVHNRAMVHARRGDLPCALRDFRAAEQELEHLGYGIDAKIVARAEVMAMAGLHEDVIDELPAAVARLDAAGLRTDAAEGRLYLALSAMSLGEDGAAEQAKRASESFRAAGREGWAAIAEDIRLQDRLQSLGARTVGVDEVSRAASELEACGMRVFAAGSWLRVAAVAEAHGRLDLAGAALDRVDGRHRSLAMRLLAFEARAARHVLAGRRAQAARTSSGGRRLLIRHRALFEATELRAQASGWGAGLAALDIRLAWDERPASLLAATERWRATTDLDRSGRLGDGDDDLATLLARYRAVHAGAAEAERDACPGDETARDLREAERAVATALRVRSRAGEDVDDEPSWAATRCSLGDRRLVELVEHAGMMRALVASPRRVTAVDLGSAAHVVSLAATATRALRQLAPVAGLPAGALVARSAAAALASLRRAVIAPLEHHLGSGREVIVVPSGPLFALPWVYLFGGERVVSVVPSARHWMRAGRQLDHGPARTLVVAGPGLRGATHEAHRVAAVHHSSLVLCGPEATAARFLHEAETAGLAHVAAHAQFHIRNPLFSHLLLVDGPLTAHDLDRLRRPPRIVVLSACSSAAVSSRAGGELLGLSTVLLSGGCAGLVVTTLPVPDGDIVPLLDDLHRGLADGRSLGEAVARSTAAADTGTPLGLLLACALSCFGRSDVTHPTDRAARTMA